METLTALCRKQCMHCHFLTVSFIPIFQFQYILWERITESPVVFFPFFFFFFKHTYYNTSYWKKDAITLVCETGIKFMGDFLAPFIYMVRKGNRHYFHVVGNVLLGFYVKACFNHLTIFATWVLNDCSFWIFIMGGKIAAVLRPTGGSFTRMNTEQASSK